MNVTIFKLSISSSIFGYSSRTISDTKNQTLEERLDKFCLILLEIAEVERVNRLKHEEVQRQAEIERKILEQQEREYRAEMKRRDELEQLSELFTKSDYIYQFIRKVESKIKVGTLNQEQVERFNEWKRWALDHANRLNPVVQTNEAILKQKKTGLT